MNVWLIYAHPIWVTAVIIFIMLLVMLEIGYWLGRWRQHMTSEREIVSGDIALTSMYAILGLVMAFTYSFTISRADNRKQSIIAEANALGTAFLRADFVAEPNRTELRTLLRGYTETRLISSGDGASMKRMQKVLDNSLQLQSELWPITVRIIEEGSHGAIDSLIVQSINEVIDMHSIRVASAFDRLPIAIFWLLLFNASVVLAVSGYNKGLMKNMNRLRMTALVLVLTAVMMTIIDFDRGLDGFVKTSQQPIIDVLASMDNAILDNK